MAPPRYIYQRHGQPLLSWAGGPPSQSRAADAKSLGDYQHPATNPYGLPLPGAPEFLGNYEMVIPPSSSPPIGQRGVGDAITDSIGLPSIPGGIFTYGIGAYLLYRHFKKKR